MNYFHSELLQTPRALDYLKSRGVTDDFITSNPYVRFGYNRIDDFTSYRVIRSAFDSDISLKTGLYWISDKGKVRPSLQRYHPEAKVFLDCVLCSYQVGGRTKYIIGRTLPRPDIDTANYRFSKLRTKEPSIVKNEIFGVDSLEIKNPDFPKSVLIAEGLFDAILPLQMGIPTISPITVSFSNEQIAELIRLTKRSSTIYICPDPDNPGEKGAVKTAKLLFGLGKEVKIILLPKKPNCTKYDLADYLREHTYADFVGICNKAIALLDFLIQKVPQDTSKTELTNELNKANILQLISNIPDPIHQEHYVEALHTRFDIPKGVFRKMIDDIPERASEKEVKSTEPPQKVAKTLLDYDLQPGDLVLPADWLITNILAPLTITVMFSDSGVGKSFFMLLAACWLLQMKKIDTIIYLDRDNSKRALKARRIEDIKTKFGKHFIYVPDFKCDSQVMAVLQNDLSSKKYGHCLVVIDSLRNFMEGNPNEDRDSIAFMEKMKNIRNMDNTVILLHHTNKSGVIKNNTSFVDYADLVWCLTADDKKDKTLFLDFEMKKDRIGVLANFKSQIDMANFSLRIEEGLVAPSDQAFVDCVTSKLNMEFAPLKQSEIIATVKSELNINSVGKITGLLDKYTNIIWSISRGEKNSSLYSIIEFNGEENNNNIFVKYNIFETAGNQENSVKTAFPRRRA